MRTNAQVAIAVLAVLLTTALAVADPEPQTPTDPPTAAERQAAAALDVNQAEIAAGVMPDDGEPATPPVADRSGSPMIMEIRAALEQSQAEVAELAARVATAAPAAREALQQQISTLKQQLELDILAIQVRHARAAGNEALAQEIEAAIATIQSPPPPEPPAVPRPAPGVQP